MINSIDLDNWVGGSSYHRTEPNGSEYTITIKDFRVE